jgi:N-acetylglucosamine-6-phosphate deacetylase
MEAFLNADILTGSAVLHDHAVLVEDGVIAAIVGSEEIPSNATRTDLRGRNLAAGFVDLQVNGGGGILLNTHYDEASVVKVLEAHRSLGTTSIFPTVFTSSFEAMKGLLHSVETLRAKGELGLAGIHFEGPIIEAAKAGVHDRNFIREAESSLLSFFADAAQRLPVIVTLAPERVEAQVITNLKAAGVKVLGGHSNATFEQTEAALNAGLSGGTHLFNAMSAFTSREPGMVGALLANDDAWASIIVDGHHVHWGSVRAAWRAMTPGQMFLVTDAMPCVGSSQDAFELGDLSIHVRNGRCETEDGVLAGSALDMVTGVRNLVQKVGVTLPEAVRMANQYPSLFAGLADRGRLEVGLRADFLAFDNQMRAVTTYVSGRELPIQQS